MAKATASVYLKLVDKNRNQVLGECYDHAHLNEIILVSWDWGVTDPAALPKEPVTPGATTSPAKAMAGGEADNIIKPALFKFGKLTDTSTVRLINAIDAGEIFPKATISIKEEFEAATNPFDLTIDLTDVFLTKMDWNASSSGAGREFTETYELNYKEIHFLYIWRGTPPKPMQAFFEGPKDQKPGAIQKATMTDKEKAAHDQKIIDEMVTSRLKKAGK